MKAWLLLCLAAFSTALAANGKPGKFDGYVLALSWSPTYCEEQPKDREQCGKKLGLVLHGLWPQYNVGYPSFCTKEAYAPSQAQAFPELYPSEFLFEHEWEKHGTCSGLTQAGYFQLSQALKSKVAIPEAYQRPQKPFRTTADGLKSAFTEANPWLKEQAIAPFCSGGGRFFKEMFVCLDKGGATASCSADVVKSAAKSCGQKDFLVRNIK
ncbi:ribonuclease T2 family protein [Methylomonas sp. YC3]